MDRQQQTGSHVRLSRRGFNRLAVGAAATVAFAAGHSIHDGRIRSVGAQTDIAATPPARPVAQWIGGYGPTIASKAAELGYDLDRIALFVTEEIRYEPYVGALRGANATMWGFAGNSVDQALLLAALLTEAQITWRFAAGPLDDSAANALLELGNSGITTVGERWGKAVEASLTPTGTILEATPVASGTPAQEAGDDGGLVADTTARAAFAAKEGQERFTNLAAQIARALDGAAIAITPSGKTDLPDAERSRHLWVQIADGPRWTDITPTLPPDTSRTMPAPTETFDLIPDDLIHTISVRISVETLSGTSLIVSDVAMAQMSAVEAARAPIEIGVAPPQAMAAAGFAISEVVSGTSGMVPYLAAGDAVLQAASNPVPFTGGGGALDVLGAATPDAASCGCQDGDLVAMSYTVDITSPGEEPVTVQRYLIDRLSPEARLTATTSVDPAAISRLNLVDLPDGVTMPAELTASTFLAFTTGDIPALYLLQAPGLDLAMAGMASIGGTQAGLTASYGRTQLLPNRTYAFVAVPQAVAFSVGTADGREDGGLLMQGDILHQGRSMLANADGVTIAGLHPLVASGILSQVAEDVVLEPAFLMGSADSPIEHGVSVGKVFAEAATQGVPIVALGASGGGAMPPGIAPDVSARISAALDAGKIVVIPEKPVQLGSQTATGWWEIDPTTGRTVDVYANGKGYVEAHGPVVSTLAQAAEEAEILTEVNTWRPWYQRLGRCVGAAAMIGGMAVATEGAVSVGTGGNAANALFKLAMANPKFFKDLAALKGCY